MLWRSSNFETGKCFPKSDNNIAETVVCLALCHLYCHLQSRDTAFQNTLKLSGFAGSTNQAKHDHKTFPGTWPCLPCFVGVGPMSCLICIVPQRCKVGSCQRYQILSHVFARCASQKTHGHARIARFSRATCKKVWHKSYTSGHCLVQREKKSTSVYVQSDKMYHKMFCSQEFQYILSSLD